MDSDMKAIVTVFQHNSSSTETKPTEPHSVNQNISLKRRLETNDTRSLGSVRFKRLERNISSNKSHVSIYTMDCDRFIQEVKARPGIWEVDNMHYKNKMRVRKMWEEIQKKFPGISVDDLKKRWKNLKDTYRKELKRYQNNENSKSTWRYYDSLYFLKAQFNRNPNDNKDNIETESYQETSSMSPTSPASSKSDDDDEEERDIPYTLKANVSDVKAELLLMERKKMKILEDEIARSNQHMKSDNYHFLMSLLPEMDKLGTIQKMRLRTKISQAVLDEVSLSIYGNDSTPQASNLQLACTYEEPNVIETLAKEIKEEVLSMQD